MPHFQTILCSYLLHVRSRFTLELTDGQVNPKPGQKDLSPGDVILWINGMLLIGFDEDTVTERFAEAFAHGAPLLIGKLSTLMKHQLQEVEDAVKKLI